MRIDQLGSKKVFVGKRVTFTCSPYQGDNVRFLWTYNERILRPGGRFVIATSAENSILTVKNLSSQDSGNYTCIASNKVSEDRSTASLLVQGSHTFLKSSNNKFALDFDI